MPQYVDYRRDEMPPSVNTKTGTTGGYYRDEKTHLRDEIYRTEKKRRSRRKRTEGGRRRRKRTEKRRGYKR
jgi:hypothetical protein